MRALIWSLIAVFALSSTPVQAVEPDEILKDATLEKRARDLSLGLRCLVCQNQSIDDSNAPLAKDLRVLVRERLSKGDSDKQVIDYVVARYGEYVLLNPRLSPSTLVLWFATPVMLLLAAIFMFRARRSRTSATPAAPLNTDEQKRLDELLSKDS